jgi:hypothetical protein
MKMSAARSIEAMTIGMGWGWGGGGKGICRDAMLQIDGENVVVNGLNSTKVHELKPGCHASSPGFDPGFPHSLLRGGRNHDCVK